MKFLIFPLKMPLTLVQYGRPRRYKHKQITNIKTVLCFFANGETSVIEVIIVSKVANFFEKRNIQCNLNQKVSATFSLVKVIQYKYKSNLRI